MALFDFLDDIPTSTKALAGAGILATIGGIAMCTHDVKKYNRTAEEAAKIAAAAQAAQNAQYQQQAYQQQAQPQAQPGVAYQAPQAAQPIYQQAGVNNPLGPNP